ncbi:AUGMIN subunit 6 [Senna tora]|uniref:AUGMIN subunit 6 n=1 Tax=Senna tora TaxID=362788 RepID=A0A834SE18_9FABA|nr:AUGMIN subunit 6 [Senna tora]
MLLLVVLLEPAKPLELEEALLGCEFRKLVPSYLNAFRANLGSSYILEPNLTSPSSTPSLGIGFLPRISRLAIKHLVTFQRRIFKSHETLFSLDPAIIGIGGSTGIPPVGRFRHSNPKLGEQLLYFILSSLRGPIQSAEDFDQVWPILDAAQSHDFRKVVQGIISELESQGALPMINARVSSLSTYCGFRFVELLWQLSLHALLEVHSRTFAADVASNPLPAPLTDAASSHAITLLPVTKAWIALERRKFLKNAEAAVQRQRMWSNLAHEMTAEFRGLYAEEAYLQQELKKVHNFRNKVKLEGELWNDLLSSSSQNSNVVSKANRLWESLLAHKVPTTSVNEIRNLKGRNQQTLQSIHQVDILAVPILPIFLTDSSEFHQAVLSMAATMPPFHHGGVCPWQRHRVSAMPTELKIYPRKEKGQQFMYIIAATPSAMAPWQFFFWISTIYHHTPLTTLPPRLQNSLDRCICKGQYEVLASDPIKDLIAHREHMYRISGSSLVAAMDHTYEAPCADKLYGQPGDLPNVFLEDKETNDALDLTNETLTGMAGKAGRVHQAVDVAEVIWHWAHALQRIEKKSLHWAKANDGEGPDILRNAQGDLSDHAESLAVTLAEHQQHLASFQTLGGLCLLSRSKQSDTIPITSFRANCLKLSLKDGQYRKASIRYVMKELYAPHQLPSDSALIYLHVLVLINQLKEVAPAIQNSISECTDKLNNITSNLPPMNRLHGRPMSPIKAHGRMNSDTDEVAEVTSRISNVQFDRRRQGTVLQTIRTENLPDRKSLDTSSSTQSVRLPEGSDSSDVQNLKREVRETALSLRPSNSVSSLDSHSDGSSEHFFAPLSESRFSHLDAKERIASLRSRRLFVSQLDSPLESHASDGHGKNQLDENLDMLNDLEKLSDYDHVNGCLSYTGSNATSETQWSVYDFEDAQDEVFSPPLLMDSSLLADSFEDLLAPGEEAGLGQGGFANFMRGVVDVTQGKLGY